MLSFFTVQLSHPYVTTGKTIDLTRWTFVGKVMSLLFNMLSRLVITFLPRSKRLLISWLQSPSAMILEPQKMKLWKTTTLIWILFGDFFLLKSVPTYCLLLLLRRFSRVWLCATPWMAAHQAPLSTGFSRQKYWSGLPFPSPTYCLDHHFYRLIF